MRRGGQRGRRGSGSRGRGGCKIPGGLGSPYLLLNFALVKKGRKAWRV